MTLRKMNTCWLSREKGILPTLIALGWSSCPCEWAPRGTLCCLPDEQGRSRGLTGGPAGGPGRPLFSNTWTGAWKHKTWYKDKRWTSGWMACAFSCFVVPLNIPETSVRCLYRKIAQGGQVTPQTTSAGSVHSSAQPCAPWLGPRCAGHGGHRFLGREALGCTLPRMSRLEHKGGCSQWRLFTSVHSRGAPEEAHGGSVPTGVPGNSCGVIKAPGATSRARFFVGLLLLFGQTLWVSGRPAT